MTVYARIRRHLRPLKTILGRVLLHIADKRVNIGEYRFSRQRFFLNQLASNLNHEDWLDDIYETVLKLKEGAFIDVGANRGQTLLKIVSIDRERQYIGFEPQIAAGFFIEQFLIENSLEKQIVIPVALSNQSGLLSLQVRGYGYDSSFSDTASLVQGFRPNEFYSYSKYVYAVPGDEIIPKLDLPSVSVIKIDVEGAELEVVEGLISCIETYKPFIVFEVLNHYILATKTALDEETVAFREVRARKLENILRSKGYIIYRICEKKEIKKVRSIKPEKVANLRTADYLAVPDTEEELFTKAIRKYRSITQA